MRTILLVALMLVPAMAALAPTAAACTSTACMQHCWIEYASIGTYNDPQTGQERDIEAPTGYRCVY